MNPFLSLVRKTGVIAFISTFLLLFFGSLAIAAEDGSTWRATYDVVMMWVNFVILAVILYKVGKKPILEFISGSRDDIAREIERLESQRSEIKDQTEETLKNIESSKTHFQEVSERIIDAGEKARQSIIEDAKNQSQMMLDDAKRKIEAQLHTAKKDFRSELIDASVDIAMKNIKTHITPNDDQRFIEKYMTAIPDKA